MRRYQASSLPLIHDLPVLQSGVTAMRLAGDILAVACDDWSVAVFDLARRALICKGRCLRRRRDSVAEYANIVVCVISFHAYIYVCVCICVRDY